MVTKDLKNRMEESENINGLVSGKSIAKNTLYNLLGYGIPLVFALVFIPPLIKGLGAERFGILNIAWMVIGYFSFFDFGIGKGLTKILAEKVSLNQAQQMSGIFWTSLFLMLAISFTGSITISFFISSFVDLFKISPNMKLETMHTFYLLAFSIPIVSTTAGLRGVLEAYQKFGIVNVMRIILGISTFLGPLVVLIITDSLFWIVAFLIFLRILIWVIYLLLCFKTNSTLQKYIKLDFDSIKPVLRFSIWITVANIVGPIILYSDRLLIGAILSATAITYYATPYEIVTKLLLISGALTGVLFPVFSSSYLNNPDSAKKILLRGVKFIFLILFPVIFIIITFSYEGMNLWLGKKFAFNSSTILQFLSIGIFMNSLSSIPNNFFQGIGRPKIPTLINLIELPFYICAMWFSIKTWGLNGAAIVYMIMATVDAVVMYVTANKLFGIKLGPKFNFLSIIIIIGVLLVSFFVVQIFIKIIFAVFVLSLFTFITWKNFLSIEEKDFLLSRLKLKFS